MPCSLANEARVSRIRNLNDTLRKDFIGGRILLSSTVNALPDHTKLAVLRGIRGFDTFDDGNDPYGEHDFVSIDVAGERYFAKIDYYAPDLMHGSENPADNTTTVRVLTIMHSSDY